jgi:hypothetical protein
MDYKIFDPEKPTPNQISSLARMLKNHRISGLYKIEDDAYDLLNKKVVTVKFLKFINYLVFNYKYDKLKEVLDQIGFKRQPKI